MCITYPNLSSVLHQCWAQQPTPRNVSRYKPILPFISTDCSARFLSFRLMNSWISYLSNRAYVFQPFTWDPYTPDMFVPIQKDSHLPNSSYTVRPSRIPLSAFVDSPITGAPWPNGDDHPRSISSNWWHNVCNEKNTLHLNTTQVNEKLGINVDLDDGKVIIDQWAAYLKELDCDCVNIDGNTPRIVNYP